jgi:hypothetical protein
VLIEKAAARFIKENDMAKKQISGEALCRARVVRGNMM